MRLFVALDLPEQAVRYLDDVQKRLRREARADRWQPLHNLHLTLHFLGEVEEALLPALCEDLDVVSAIMKPFALRTGEFGAFPDAVRPRVLWIGLGGQIRELRQLHKLLGTRFSRKEGLSWDRRPYKPHITLARGVHAPDAGLPLKEWKERFLTEEPPQWKVNQVHLFRSELRPDGAVHTILHSSTFGKDQGKKTSVF